jgi:hypothetical protein
MAGIGEVKYLGVVSMFEKQIKCVMMHLSFLKRDQLCGLRGYIRNTLPITKLIHLNKWHLDPASHEYYISD